MIALSSTDVAIRIARETGTLKVERCIDRWGGEYFAICDEHGLIEVAANEEEARARTS